MLGSSITAVYSSKPTKFLSHIRNFFLKTCFLSTDLRKLFKQEKKWRHILIRNNYSITLQSLIDVVYVVRTFRGHLVSLPPPLKIILKNLVCGNLTGLKVSYKHTNAFLYFMNVFIISKEFV